MLIIQDDYKLMLAPLKEIGSQLFNKNFLLGFFTKFIDFKKLDIKEFVFVIHLSIVLSNVGTDGIESIEEIIYEIIEIYKKYLIKNLSNTRNLIYSSNISTNSNNGEDNGARINNGGPGNLLNNGIDNGGGNQNNDNLSGQIRDSTNNSNNNNYFNETVTSIYFFCY